jgi:glucose-6-phosphate 1-epimerase
MEMLERLAGFSVPGRVEFEAGRGGLICAVLRTPTAEGRVYLHGGHVSHFQRVGGRPVLFMSGESLFVADKAIRGGVPVIFPWFGPRANDPVGGSPMHGFARVMEWEVESSDARGDSSSIVLVLRADESTRRWFGGEFVLRHRVSVGERLTMELTVENAGWEAFSFEEALHTYFSVSDVRNVSIEGLAGVSYIDKTDQMARKVQDASPIKITGETDRIYLGTRSTCVIHDPGFGRRIVIAKENSAATVVWNPWVAKAKAMADFGDEEWVGMVCVETCNVDVHAVTLPAGARQCMKAVIGVEGE